MACVSCPTYSIALNGTSFGFIKGKRGLRQGDPLSPYLFVLCMEYLSRQLRGLSTLAGFSSHPKCAKMRLNHLIFADDLLIFTRGDLSSVLSVSNCLDGFARASGLAANPDKTSIYFGGVASSVKRVILTASGFSEGFFPFKYLGMPLNASRLTVDMYSGLLAKIKDKLSHWANSFLSYVGKAQLIQAAIFGLCNFWCSGVLLPKAVVKKINKLCKDFFWNIDEGRRKAVFKSWKSLCTPRQEGGMGFKELLSWNKAILMKRFAKLSVGHRDVWCVWISKYNLNGSDIWSVCSKLDMSITWRALLQIRDEFIGVYGSVDAAKGVIDRWYNAGAKVSDFYDTFRTVGSGFVWAKTIWNCAVLPKHSFTCVLAVQNVLATVDNLKIRGIPYANRCSLCCCQEESVVHLFFSCSFSSQIWQYLLCWMGFTRRSWSLSHELRWIVNYGAGTTWRSNWFRSSLGAAIGEIWRERNRRIFQDKSLDVIMLVNRIKFIVAVRMYSIPTTISDSYLTSLLNR